MHNHDDEENHNQVDVNRLTAPVVTVIAIIGFFMWITYLGTAERGELRGRLTTLEQHIVEIKSDIDALGKRDVSAGLISNNELSIFCLRAQLINKDWKCPSINHTYNNMNNFNEGDIVKEINRLQQGINNATVPDKKVVQ